LQLNFFHENSLCFKSLFICLKHSKKTCGHVVILFQKFFFLIKFHPNISIFLETFIYSTRKDPCIQNIQKKKKTYILLDFDSETPITVLKQHYVYCQIVMNMMYFFFLFTLPPLLKRILTLNINLYLFTQQVWG